MCDQISNQDATTRDGAHDGYNQTGRRTDADACSLRRTKGEQVGGAAGSTRAFLETARASSKTCTGKSYGANKEGKQKEKRPESVRQHFVLSTRDPFFFLVLLFL